MEDNTFLTQAEKEALSTLIDLSGLPEAFFEAKPRYPFSAIPCKDSAKERARDFLFLGKEKDIIPYLLFFLGLAKGRDAQIYVILEEGEEPSPILRSLDAKILPSLSFAPSSIRAEARPYLFSFLGKDSPSLKSANLFFSTPDSSVSEPFTVIQLKGDALDPLSERHIKVSLGEEEGLLDNFLDDVFEFGYEDGPFFIEGGEIGRAHV